MFPTILIVDDEPSIIKSLSGILTDEGFDILTALNGYEALKTIDRESPDIVLLDIWMQGIDGIETLKEIKKKKPQIPVIMITGHGSIETAVNATKIGAFDFFEKPLSIDKVILGINNALNFRKLEEENQYLKSKAIQKNSIDGNSSAIIELKQQIAIAAPTDSWILISGENGTGKKLIARSIHHLSARADYPLIDVNCTSILHEHMEKNLLGYEKGSFREAKTKSIGKIELAANGTIYFDEIGNLDLKNQRKLAKILQMQTFSRIGGNRQITINIRVLASTSKDLENEIKKGNFLEELYFKLNIIPISIPSLEKRTQDIPILVKTFLEKYTNKYNTPPKKITEGALHLLKQYKWPGNIRELKNLVERLSITVSKQTLDVADIPPPYNITDKKSNYVYNSNKLFMYDNIEKAIEEFKKDYNKFHKNRS
jgi:two-component system nitrogen regulation response regulator NtrX